MALLLEINSVDKSSLIDWPSLQKDDVLTKEPDRLQFRIKNYPSKTYQPALGDDVKLYDGATLIFGGVVTETELTNDGLLQYYLVICRDYSQTMDRKLVSKTYTNQGVDVIVADLISNYMTGFTGTGVTATDTIKKIIFNDEQPSRCLQKLADMIGDCDWYVDYDKDIKFFKEYSIAAPFNLDDTGGKYIFGSLKVAKNLNQIRNSVIVRGGDKVSDLLTDVKIADGQQRTFVAKPSLQNLTIEKSTNSGGSYSTLTIGADGKDDPTTKDVLYNTNTGMIIFPDASKPASGHYIRWSGNQVYPIKVVRTDVASINTYGEYQYVIRDATIKSEDQGIQRAKAEIKKYGQPATEGYFRTTTSGLKSGQSLTVESSTLGITSKTFKITRVSLTARTPTAFEYEVRLLASENLGIIDVLGKLLVTNPAEQFVIPEDEVLVQVQGYTEVVSLGESWRTNPFGLNVRPTWVAGPYYPTNSADTKRSFFTDAGVKVS